jgi:hypothetical protein
MHEAVPGRREFINLAPADVPEMLGLVELTIPCRFAPETISLASYIGIRSQGELIAMAGERMKFDGFTKISAACSHPNRRGRWHFNAFDPEPWPLALGKTERLPARQHLPLELRSPLHRSSPAARSNEHWFRSPFGFRRSARGSCAAASWADPGSRLASSPASAGAQLAPMHPRQVVLGFAPRPRFRQRAA